MKIMKLLVLVAMFLLPAALFSQNPVHFTFTSVTGNNMTVIVPLAINPTISGVPLSAGDEIGVFTKDGLCVGATVWTGTNNRSITVWGNNDQTPEKDGMAASPPDTVYFRIWDSSEDIEYSVVVATWVGGGSRVYVANSFSPNVASLEAFSVPAQPNITAPADNSVGNALSGNIVWDVAGGADDYDVVLSANSDFSDPIINTNTTSTSVAYSGLEFNTMYYVRVRGNNDVGEGAWDEVSWKTKLAQVTLVRPADGATGLMESGTLSWNSVSGAANYDLTIATDAGFTNVVVNTNVGTTSYNYTNLDNYETYYWKVQAKDGANTGDESETRDFRIRVGSPVITAPVDGSTGLAVNGNATWTAVDGATKYRMQIATDVDFINIVEEVNNIALTNQNYSGLSNYTNYFIRVFAGDDDGEGIASATVTFRTILGIPTNLTPANGSFAQPLAGNLTWSAVTGATTYNVQISTNAAFTNIVVDANTAAATYAYAGLNNNTQYFWRVRAGEDAGFNAFSTHTSFTTLLGQVVLNTPVNNATGVSPLSGMFTWTALAGATNYRIQVATDVNFVNMVINQDGIAATTFNYTNLNSVTTYFWRVIGYNANDAGQNSAVFQFLTSLGKVALVAPANNAVGVELNGVNFSWGAVNGAESYRLQISEQSDFSSFVVNTGGIAATSTVINGLMYNKTYYWRANAQNTNDGEGPFSDSRTFQTKVEAPTLLTPADNETDVILDGQMTWTTVPGADSYQVQVSLFNDFSSTVISATNGTTTYNYSGLENNKQHYWRVRGIKNGGYGDWSTVFTFETMNLAAPVLLSPVNGKLNQFIDVTFTWESVTDATGYNFRLASDAGFTNIVASGNNLGTTSFSVTGLFKDRKYYWQVQTIGLQGVSNWSTAFNFTTIKAPVVSGPNSVCQSSQAMYSTEFFDVIDYQWTVTGGTIVGASTLSTVTVDWGTNTSGSVKVTRSSAEWGVYTDNATMNVSLTPIAMITVGIDAEHYYEGNACMNETVKFTGTTSSENPVVWNWDMGDGTMKTGKIVSHVYAAAGDYTVTLTVTNGVFCERGEETYDIEVRDDCPLTILADAELESCKEASPTFQSVVFGGSGDYSFLWHPANDFVDATVLNATVKRAVFSKEYKLTIFDNESDETLVTYPYLKVLASPNASLSKGFVVVKGMGSIDLTDPSILVVSVSGGQAPYIHRWVDNNGQEVDPTNVNPPVGSTQYFVTIIDDNGCLSVEKRFIVFRTASKDAIPEDVVAGLSGSGFMFTYPNPVIDNLNIIAEFDEQSYTTVRVMNLLGEEVLYLNLGSMKSLETEINLRHLTKGFYNLVVETENNTFVKPFIKE
ncbi:MAG: PKD domain-containing protein [Candidatus Kapabacteria bacterium]|nr:PKD domain-containing protein [Candidatus Kapabacteria bacterium]